LPAPSRHAYMQTFRGPLVRSREALAAVSQFAPAREQHLAPQLIR
jgi:hypothetical protein